MRIERSKIFFVLFIFSLFIAPSSFAAGLHPVNTTITSVIPTTVKNGEQVEINGINFGNAPANNAQVVISGGILGVDKHISQQVISWSDTSIKFIVNGTQWGSHIPYIKWFDEQTKSDNFTGWTAASFKITDLSCPADKLWTCTNWGACSVGGIQTRTCVENIVGTNCAPSPVTSQSCTPPQPQQIAPAPVSPPSYQQPIQPSCLEDTWNCADWGACSPQGIQTRSCKRSYDCPSAETPAPATSQYCQSNYQPPAQSYSPPSQSGGGTAPSNENVDQDLIMRSSVQLVCCTKQKCTKQGSGTIVDPKGIILTNQHVVDGTIGCGVGFVDNPEEDPNFNEIADIARLSNDEDIALLKIRNPGNKIFDYVNILSGSVNGKNLGNRIMIFGFPGIGGSKLTYSEGSLSGFGSAKDGLGNYLKTTAFIEHGNSGGGAYLANNGSFIGIPSRGIPGELASLGYILSVNKIKNWINASGLTYNGGFKNLSTKYVSLSLEDVDVNNLDILNVSKARVLIYSDKLKTAILPNNPGTVQIYKRPTFQIDNIDEEDEIVGYYVYFGTNVKADPVKKGKFIKKSEYTPATITQKGVYYFIFRAKDSSGNFSDSVITEYRYKK